MSPQLIEAIVILAAQYGPEFISEIVALFKQKTVTVDQIEALFSGVKPYAYYQIPATVPTIG